MKRPIYIVLVALTACSVKETIPVNQPEIRGIRAYIDGAEPETRATVTRLADYVGRSKFRGGDQAVFTNIRRTEYPIEEFTYPGADPYEGVTFVAGDGGGWTRGEEDGAPERVYWTDAVSPHTFVAYCKPMDTSFDWTRKKDGMYSFYEGTLGLPGESGEIVFDKAEDLEKEDLLICHDTQVTAEPGGSVALVKFSHALSSVRVVVNINGFSASSSAVDNQTVVSDMRLLHQPTEYKWMESSTGVQPSGAGEDTRRDLLLWIPNPAGVGTGQARTFTFYGITTPQPFDYLSTLPENSALRKAELRFEVTYPDPLDPKRLKTSTYSASLKDVCFEAGYNTTVNITLNHRDEQMVVGVDFEDWEFVSTPDLSQLKKNSTFLYDTDRKSVTIAEDENLTADDATWLFYQSGKLRDIYEHDGTAEHPFQISTAYQWLSFAYEVKAGRSFKGQYVALDADLTFKVPWIGVGDDKHPFEGTFLGGMRYLHSIEGGSALFSKLAEGSRLEQLQALADSTLTGTGLLADMNEGLICACVVEGDVRVSGSSAGALVGTNAGIILASYHQGTVSGGGFVGSNTGALVGCYQAGKVKGEGFVAFNNDPQLYSTEKMKRPGFVDELNAGIASWRALNAGYDDHRYEHQPAGYPHLKQ